MTMGNRVHKLFKFTDREFVSAKSLIAVEHTVEFLKANIRHRNIFHATIHTHRVDQICNELEKGGSNILNLLETTPVIESAAALQRYLFKMKKPLIPRHIQAIGLENNDGVTPEVVAQDILGLLRQDVTGRQGRLIVLILDLLHCVVKNSNTDELSGSHIPVTMLPLFFKLELEHITRWRRIASVFIEIILLAPEYLNMPSENPENYNENFRPDEDLLQLDEEIYARRLINFTYGRRFHRIGNRGDVPYFEIYHGREPNNNLSRF